MRRPDFETLQQQNPGRRDRLRIKAESFSSFDLGAVPSDAPVALSIDPGQKGGPNNSFSVVQAWTITDGHYLLLDQWRARARYDEFRSAVRRTIRRFRPSVVLIEATGQGPALISDTRPQQGMTLHSITPSEAKVKRLRKHQKILRAGLVSLPAGAPWVPEFINEITLFPYAQSDDQVDAVSMFLDFIIAHPVLETRPPRAIAVGRDSCGLIPLRGVPTRQEPGIVIAPRYRRWWP
jgi:predicted phage terminase large subunit-like protein